MGAISESRWKEAQKYEAEYWEREKRNPIKLSQDIADGHHFTKGVLDIRPETLAGNWVLDIAGGPYPIGVGMGLHRYAVLDPAKYDRVEGVERITSLAEDYAPIEQFAEVWGYNVLQHVRDPAKVMETVRYAALSCIRWFDVVDTPVYPVHPHSISAEWLRVQLSQGDWRITRDIDGSRLVEGARQKWVALVAQRTTFSV